MRLNVYISKSGYSSRRKADSLIKSGKVRVNGKVVKEPFVSVDENDEVKVEGKVVTIREYVYLVFNKPKGVVTTCSDRFAAKKVIDFFSAKYKGIFPVGRLDKDSCGLLLLTNDGQLCYALTHPKFEVQKEYVLELNGYFRTGDWKKAKAGVYYGGELLKVMSGKILRHTKDRTICRAVVCEGKKRHLRRLFKKLGFEVKELKRVRIGGLRLGNLAEGKYRLLSREQAYKISSVGKHDACKISKKMLG